MEPVGFHFLRGAASVLFDHLHTHGMGDRHVQITGHTFCQKEKAKAISPPSTSRVFASPSELYCRLFSLFSKQLRSSPFLKRGKLKWFVDSQMAHARHFFFFFFELAHTYVGNFVATYDPVNGQHARRGSSIHRWHGKHDKQNALLVFYVLGRPEGPFRVSSFFHIVPTNSLASIASFFKMSPSSVRLFCIAYTARDGSPVRCVQSPNALLNGDPTANSATMSVG